MKSTLSPIILAAFILVMPAVNAHAKMEETPDTARGMPRLLWQMTDVPPPCLDALYPMGEAAPPSVDIPSCSKDDSGKPWPSETEGFGLTTHYGDEDGFAAYHVVGIIPEGTVVETLVSGGGTGLFSGVAIVKVDGDKLVSMRTFDGGDRCNGGVHASRIEGGKVVVENNITPGDFTAIAYGDSHGVNAYDDVIASAASCVGQTVSVDGTITQIILDPEALAFGLSDEDDKRYPLQKCFNKHFNAQVEKSTALTLPEFRSFMDILVADCRTAKTQ